MIITVNFPDLILPCLQITKFTLHPHFALKRTQNVHFYLLYLSSDSTKESHQEQMMQKKISKFQIYCLKHIT